MSSSYTAEDIEVLQGIAHVRRRPAMYIGSTGTDGLHHLLWEIVDNSVDEAMNGHASFIKVTLSATGDTVTVEDNGRGIPVDVNPKHGNRSALELVLTEIGAGGKFSGNNYKASGGLHGVGSSVVNALSVFLEARVKRDGHEWMQTYKRGRPKKPIANVGPARGTGTTITFTPDPEMFEETTFDPDRIQKALEVKTFLNSGLRIVFRDLVNRETYDMKHEEGLKDYLRVLVERSECRSILDAPFELGLKAEDVRIELALTWTDSPK
ncbi:MAG: DNA topoisomerase IV subunit B, partial [Myxococcales bacterium]|nr:DNA topoisomerase IV subunit B [Myxococcales bacterium]